MVITVAKQSEDSQPRVLPWATDPVRTGDAVVPAGSEKIEHGSDQKDPERPRPARMFRSSKPGGTGVGYFPAWRKDRTRPVTHKDSFAGSFNPDTEPATSELLRLAALRVRDSTTDPGDSKIPWVTFVLGSGCLGREHPVTSDSASSVERTIEKLVADGLSGEWAKGIETDSVQDCRDWTVDFILELALTRAPGRVAEWAEQASVVEAEEARLATLASAAAALGTKLFLNALAVTRTTVASAQRETVILDFTEDLVGLQHRYFDLLVAVATEFERLISDGTSPAMTAFADVLANIRRTKTLPRERVEVLGAFAWHFWTDKTTMYPGWSDILLFQAAETQNAGDQFLEVPMLRRPNVTQLGRLQSDHRNSWLYLRLLDITQKSWDEAMDGRVSDRERFYEAVAGNLIQQAALARKHQKPRGAPLATAFVSGFDLELEMALLRNLKHDGDFSRFAIVVPVFHVHTAQGSDQSAEAKYDTTLCWVWKFVDGEKEAESTLPAPLEGLLNEGEWNYCDTRDTSVQKLEELLHGVPVVVRLSGAPLIDVATDRFAEPLPDWDEGHEIRPALLLDENTSLIQVALDLRGLDGRLPGALARDSDVTEFDRRYWMFVGVQLSDPAVRLRLLSREFSLAWGEVNERPKGLASDRGVIVNTWAPAAERQLFHWQGFGVVKAEAADITDDVAGLVARTARLIATQAAQA